MSQSETHASPFQMVRDKHICSWVEMILHSSWNREGLAVTKCLGTIMLEKEKFIWLYVFRSFRVWLLNMVVVWTVRGSTLWGKKAAHLVRTRKQRQWEGSR